MMDKGLSLHPKTLFKLFKPASLLTYETCKQTNYARHQCCCTLLHHTILHKKFKQQRRSPLSMMITTTSNKGTAAAAAADAKHNLGANGTKSSLLRVF